ncbi:MAG: hypothetical protein AMJ81_05755 [Phycisphaerae bacterium SM23_33]|nr:MAG: hypothetical protein AMJ81_05755 [Phycisphaerae bacterium SM23_33]
MAAGAGRAEVVRFQNGAAPAPDYGGCVDTRISIYNDQEARRGGDGRTRELRTFSTARRILIRFDVSTLPKGRPVGRALLRVYCASPTQLGSGMFAAPLTRDWDETATGFEYKKTDDDKGPEGNWASKGGDYDAQALIQAACRGGLFGHGFEFDVTGSVNDWVSGKRPNHGLILWSSPHTEHRIASSEWSVAEFRPELLVAADADELKCWPEPAKKVALSPAADAPDPGRAEGPYRTVGMGLRNDAQLRAGVQDAYLKTWPELPGNWDWMPMLRVGGGAGNQNVAVLRFDLSGLAEKASVKSARLRLYVVGGSRGVRFGLYDDQANAVVDVEAGDPVAVAAVTFPAKDASDQRAFIEWDVTGAVRAAMGKSVRTLELAASCKVEGGAFDAYSSRYDDPDNRPVLELEASPAPAVEKLPPIEPPVVPAGDYWVEPMRDVHKRFKGTPRTLGQYGDSITITMAFLATHASGSCIPKKCPPEVRKHLQIVDNYANKRLWGQWKHPRYGNNGSMTVAWAFANVDAWQKLCQPEVAVILFGTNDVSYGPVPPDHTEMMASVVDRCLADGTIPILTTLPPRGDQKGDTPHNKSVFHRVQELRRAQLAIARARKIPLIDFYGEIISRQPENWDKLLMGDRLHPSYRDPWKQDFTPEGLKNSGYTLRNYLTMMMYAGIIEKVLQPAGQAQSTDE